MSKKLVITIVFALALSQSANMQFHIQIAGALTLCLVCAPRPLWMPVYTPFGTSSYRKHVGASAGVTTPLGASTGVIQRRRKNYHIFMSWLEQ